MLALKLYALSFSPQRSNSTSESSETNMTSPKELQTPPFDKFVVPPRERGSFVKVGEFI